MTKTNEPIKHKTVHIELYKDFYKEYLARRKKQDKQRKAIKKKNDDLIAHWKSIPWYRFWERPSFEEQRRIIMDNWSKLK